MKVIITFTFCCDDLWKSKFVALEKPGKLGEFSPTLWPPWFSLGTVACSTNKLVCSVVVIVNPINGCHVKLMMS